LVNKTAVDWFVDKDVNISIFGMLATQNSIVGTGTDVFVTFERPIFLPAKQRLRFHITSIIPFKGDIPDDNANEEVKKAHKKEMSLQLKSTAGNLNGFVLYDHTMKIQVNLPNGWEDSDDEPDVNKTD